MMVSFGANTEHEDDTAAAARREAAEQAKAMEAFKNKYNSFVSKSDLLFRQYQSEQKKQKEQKHQ